MKISAVVLTKNEEKNIKRCLESLTWCDEIVIVDDFSKDKTLEIARNKLKIYKRYLEGDFAAQRNFALAKAKGEWVLFVDADEVISETLSSEIKSKITPSADGQKSKITGYYIKRKDFFLGKWLNHGETGRIKLLRLGKKEAGRWQGRVHETWQLKGELEELKSPLFHYPHKTVSQFLDKINWYTDLVAQYRMEQGKRVSPWQIIFYPKAKFILNYFIKLGFLDGVPGLIMAIMMSFHSFLSRGKLFLMRNKK